MTPIQKPTAFEEIGCRKCGKGGEWRIFTDGKDNFQAKHSCGHVSDFDVRLMMEQESIDLRFLI